jgi:hypothetical protein
MCRFPRVMMVGLAAGFVIFVLPSQIRAQQKDRPAILLEIESLRQRIKTAETTFLAPSAEDMTSFADFLRQPNTGLARLMPRETYDHALLIRGGGAFFSFTERSNEYGNASDLGLEQNSLGVGFAGANFGFLTSLGSVPVGSVTEDLPGVRFLADFVTPTTEPEAREQQRRTGTGFDLDGFTYRSWLPVSLNTTFALRSVNYDSSDVLVVFNVSRKDSDGSLILAWKLLRKFSTPQLVR